MILDDQSKAQLKEWLCSYLSQSNSSDFDVLADYVLTLLERDMETSDLKAYMIGELDTFIADSNEFVGSLFKAIQGETISLNEPSNQPQLIVQIRVIKM